MLRILKRIARAAALLVLALLLWYAQCRWFASSRATDYHEANAPPSADTDRGSFTIAAYNIAHGRGGRFGASNWTGSTRDEALQHLTEIADHIAAAKPDIVILNEVDIDSLWSRRINQARFIGEQAGFPFILTQRNLDIGLPFLSFRFGNAVLSKYPLTDVQLIDFPALSRREELLAGDHDGIACKAHTPWGEILILAVHLEYRSERIRNLCALQMIAIVESNDVPAVLAGDFNSAPKGFPRHDAGDGANAMDTLIVHGYHPSLPANTNSQYMTFPSESPDRVIDWILTTESLAQSNRTVYPSALSDHLMVTAEIAPR